MANKRFASYIGFFLNSKEQEIILYANFATKKLYELKPLIGASSLISAPTILELCNLEIPENMQGISMKTKLVSSQKNDFQKTSVISEYYVAAAMKAGSRGSVWDGVRNYQAANNLKKMEIGDLCFFLSFEYWKRNCGNSKSN